MFTPEDRERLREGLVSAAYADTRITLGCLRHGVPAIQGRGIDYLPPEITEALSGALVASLEVAELKHAFQVTSEALLGEIERVDADLANRLTEPLRELTR